jgi:hypothetical protein
MNTLPSVLAAVTVTLLTIGQAEAQGRAPTDLPSFPFSLGHLEYPDYAKQNRTADQIAYCTTIVEDLKRRKNVQIVRPRAESDSIEELQQRNAFGKCQAANFAKSFTFGPRIWDSIRDLPGDEQEQYGTAWFMSKQFRLYEVDIDNNPKNGREIVLYGAGATSSKGQKADYTYFVVPDLKTCQTKFSAQVYDVVHHPDATVGIFHHRNDVLVFETKYYPREASHSLVLQRMAYVPKRKRLLFSHVCHFITKKAPDMEPNSALQPTPKSGAVERER